MVEPCFQSGGVCEMFKMHLFKAPHKALLLSEPCNMVTKKRVGENIVSSYCLALLVEDCTNSHFTIQRSWTEIDQPFPRVLGAAEPKFMQSSFYF